MPEEEPRFVNKNAVRKSKSKIQEVTLIIQVTIKIPFCLYNLVTDTATEELSQVLGDVPMSTVKCVLFMHYKLQLNLPTM